MTTRITAFLVLCLAVPLSAKAQITFVPIPPVEAEETIVVPVVNETVRVRLAQTVDSVTVTWRPNSAIPETETVAVNTDAFEWTPTRSGVARFDLIGPDGSQSQNVSVQYDSYPASGILVLIVAGIILFGGAGFAMGKLLGGERPKASSGPRFDS